MYQQPAPYSSNIHSHAVCGITFSGVSAGIHQLFQLKQLDAKSFIQEHYARYQRGEAA